MKVEYFDIVAPPLNLAKTVPKSYQTDNGEYAIYVSYVAYISPIAVSYIIKINEGSRHAGRQQAFKEGSRHARKVIFQIIKLIYGILNMGFGSRIIKFGTISINMKNN